MPTCMQRQASATIVECASTSLTDNLKGISLRISSFKGDVGLKNAENNSWLVIQGIIVGCFEHKISNN